MIEKAIEQGRKSGFKSIGLIHPTSLFSYKYPNVSPEEVQRVRGHIIGLYKKIAEKKGFDTTKTVKVNGALYRMKKL